MILLFFFNDDIINLDSKISDYKGAQKRSTPIHIQINYLIHVIYEGSEKAPKEYHHPFSSEQTVGDVLQLYAKDDKNRGELKYENKRIEPETKLSKIDYRKEEPLLVKMMRNFTLSLIELEKDQLLLLSRYLISERIEQCVRKL